MSLPVPATTPAGGGSGAAHAFIDPKELEAMDAPLIALANRSGGDLRKLLYAFFSFLHRRTDFYIVPADDEDDGAGKAKMGFREGDAEKLLLAAFRQFPLRKMPKQADIDAMKKKHEQQSKQQSDVSSKKQNVTETTNSHKDGSSEDKAVDGNVNQETNDRISSSKPKSDDTTAIRYTEEGLQIPVGNGGTTSRYKWTQTLEECSVLISIPQTMKGKDLDVAIKPTTISVRTKVAEQGRTEPTTYVDGTLVETIIPDESSWTLEGGVLILVLYKKKKTFWKTIVIGDEEIDATLVDSKRHIDTYDETTQAHIRKIIFDQNQYHLGLPTSDEIIGKVPKIIPPLPPGVEYINQEVIDKAEKKK